MLPIGEWKQNRSGWRFGRSGGEIQGKNPDGTAVVHSCRYSSPSLHRRRLTDTERLLLLWPRGPLEL